MITVLVGILLIWSSPTVGIWCYTCRKCDYRQNSIWTYCPSKNVCGRDITNGNKSMLFTKLVYTLKARILSNTDAAKQYCINKLFIEPLRMGCNIFYHVN